MLSVLFVKRWDAHRARGQGVPGEYTVALTGGLALKQRELGFEMNKHNQVGLISESPDTHWLCLRRELPGGDGTPGDWVYSISPARGSLLRG